MNATDERIRGLKLLRIAAWITLLGFIIYFALEIIWGINPSFSDFIQTLWGRVVLVDLGIGLAIFGAWITYRERNITAVLIWWFLLIILGNIATLIYLIRALTQSIHAKDPQVLFSGTKASQTK